MDNSSDGGNGTPGFRGRINSMDEEYNSEPMSGSKLIDGQKKSRDCSDINGGNKKHSFIQVDDPIDERDEIEHSQKRKIEK